MCGRFSQAEDIDQLKLDFGAETEPGETLETLQMKVEGSGGYPNYNVSPGNESIFVYADGIKYITTAEFGFCPGWWKKKRTYILNARAEGDLNPTDDPNYTGPMGIFDKPFFRQAIVQRRGLLPIQYFIEGPKDEKLKKPHLVSRKDGSEFTLGIIHELWHDQEKDTWHNTFAIVTTGPNNLMSKIGHHRSPVVIPLHLRDLWLDPQTPRIDVEDMMRPWDPMGFYAYPISPTVRPPNKRTKPNNSPHIMQPTGPSLFPDGDPDDLLADD